MLIRKGNFFSKKWEFICLTFIMAIGCLIIFYRFIFCGDLFLYFGDANDDTFQYYLPMFQMIASKIRNLDFTFFGLTWGIGTNILTNQGYDLNPFLAPLYFGGAFFGDEWIASALIWLQIVQIFSVGYAGLFYLKQFQLNEISRVIASAAFAFSAYSIGGIGQHYFFASFPCFMALFLAALEQAMCDQKKLAFLGAITALLCACSIYAAYMILLTGGVYVLLRCLLSNEYQMAKKVKQLALLLITVLIGIFVSAIVFFPVFYQMLFTSSRIQISLNWSAWLRINNASELKSIFLRFFSDTMEGSVNHWQGYDTAFNVPHIYMSGLLIACIPQHIASLKQANKRTRSGFIIGYTLFFVSLFSPIIGVIYNMFNGYMGRYIFAFLPFAAYIVAQVITNAQKEGTFSWAAACISLFLSVCACFLGNRSPASLIASMAPIAAVIWLFCLAQKKNRKAIAGRKIAEKASVIFVSFSMIIVGWDSLYVERGIVSKETYHAMYTDSISSTLRSLQREQEISFYRTEYVYTGWSKRPTYGNAMSMDYYGISSYNNVTSKRYQAYHRYFGNPYDNPNTTAAAYSYWQMGRPLDKVMADLWGLRYIVSTYPENDHDWNQTYLAEPPEVGSFWILENPDVESAGTVFYAWYPEEELDHMTDLQRQMALSQAVSLDAAPADVSVARLSLESSKSIPYPVDQFEIPDSGLEVSISDMMNSIKMDRTRYWLVFQTQTEQNATLMLSANAGNGYGENSGQNGVYSIRPEDIEKEYILPVSENTLSVYFSLPNAQTLSIRNLKLVSCSSSNYTTNNVHTSLLGRSNKIVSSIFMERDGIFVMPVCADIGWNATVDGEQVPLLTANKCFLALELSSGEHEVVFQYKTPFLKLGALVSLIGLLAMSILHCLCNRRLAKRFY